MGYNTAYSLDVQVFFNGGSQLVDSPDLDSIITQLRLTNESADYALNEDGSMRDECKWYEHEKDMRAFSQHHPAVLFTLHGEGERGGDLWTKYFLDGKCQVAEAEIQIAPFDFEKLA
jgi:hypothetical protein